MEALAGVSLAANVLQFIDFTTRLVSTGVEIHKLGASSENGDLETITRRLVEFNHDARELLASRQPSNESPTNEERVSVN